MFIEVNNMLHILEHTLLDSLNILPFLLLTFLLIELIEHRYSNIAKKVVEKSGKFGPIVGSFLGIIPQCGFSVVATNLYVTKVISLGTLLSIYLSTSDEMLPILISKKVNIGLILLVLGIKLIVGILFGFIINYFFGNKSSKVILNYDVCDDEHCDCKHSILLSSIKHTLKIFMFLLIATLIINILFEYTSESIISKIFMKDNIFGPFIGSLIGLIPNCGASVILTELYISGGLSFASLISGLLTGSGVAILILFRTNKNLKENLSILSMLYFIGVFIGIFIEFLIYLL